MTNSSRLQIFIRVTRPKCDRQKHDVRMFLCECSQWRLAQLIKHPQIPIHPGGCPPLALQAYQRTQGREAKGAGVFISSVIFGWHIFFDVPRQCVSCLLAWKTFNRLYMRDPLRAGLIHLGASVLQAAARPARSVWACSGLTFVGGRLSISNSMIEMISSSIAN